MLGRLSEVKLQISGIGIAPHLSSVVKELKDHFPRAARFLSSREPYFRFYVS